MMTACVAPCSWAGRSGASGTHRPLGLTSRELEVLSMVADGWSNKRIATALYVSPRR
jgi:DNA-binding NarL/FixJ family response regulator